MALRTPALWVSLSIEISSRTRVNIGRYAEPAGHWFKRAGSVPLSLKVHNRLYPDNRNGYSLMQLTLLPHAHQIRQLNMSFAPVVPDATSTFPKKPID